LRNLSNRKTRIGRESNLTLKHLQWLDHVNATTINPTAQTHSICLDNGVSCHSLLESLEKDPAKFAEWSTYETTFQPIATRISRSKYGFDMPTDWLEECPSNCNANFSYALRSAFLLRIDAPSREP
jgi:hypothetical protein